MRLRLFLAFTAIIIITLVILGFSVRRSTLHVVNNFANSGGFIGADRVAASLEDYYTAYGSWEYLEEFFPLFATGDHMSPGAQYGPMMGPGSRGMMNFYLTDTHGTPIYSPEEEFPDPLSGDDFELAIALHHDQEIIGYLVPSKNLPFLRDVFQTDFSSLLTRALLPTVLVSGALALFLATLVGYFLLRPVHQLTTAAENLALGDLTQRVTVQGKDELATLGKTFNQMAASLEQAEKSRQTMTADIAHELRTPLAVQRANLEALQDGLYPLTMENLVPIMEQNQMLTRLVEELRTLAQTDYDTLALEKHPHNLAKLLEQIKENFKLQAARKNIKLTFSPPSSCPPVEVDARRMNQVINNLVQNAILHTPEGGEIIISLDCLEKSLQISVRDTGPGISPEDLPHIFERFYRTDHSRAKDKGGSGLGLTIAKRLVEAHGGTLTAQNHPAGGAVFKLNLPRS